MKNIKKFEDFVNEGYLSVGNVVKVTYPDHKDVDKIGVIKERDGDFLTVDMGTHEIRINASSIVDLSVNENLNEELFGARRDMKTRKNLENIKEISDKEKENEPGAKLAKYRKMQDDLIKELEDSLEEDEDKYEADPDAKGYDYDMIPAEEVTDDQLEREKKRRREVERLEKEKNNPIKKIKKYLGFDTDDTTK